MGKQALNTYLEPEQKVRLERVARMRKVSQATIVREAIEQYVNRLDSDQPNRSVVQAWTRLLGGYYAGDGRANDHDDIYR
jgi:predicted transcriptional regulator